ncbi:Lrp/AsnC family transcriptional regulator [Rhodovulum sp. DZ06]|uniref:Lrp/AsnC family transcriptional regulator n=1 Tax=Rhodovulum sp. DZ06 TaxID=3425126 RepID=UPI003D351419
MSAQIEQSPELDRIDRAILRVLQQEGRLSNADLAARVHLSPSACHRRVARLEAKGVIRGYAALVAPRALGRGSTVFVEITLAGQSTEALEAFEAAAAALPDVMECHLMAGAADYLLKVVTRGADDFARIHREQLSSLPGVARMQSSFSLKEVSRRSALPVD